MSEHSACPIWSTPASIEPQSSYDGATVDSPRAGGRYIISGTATAMLQGRNEDLKARLTSWLIEQRQLGADCPKIISTSVKQVVQRRRLSIHQRANNLLRYIQGELPDIGSDFSFETHVNAIEDFQPIGWTRRYLEMLAWSESTNVEELKYLLDYLESESWLQGIPGGATLLKYRLTVRGYSYLAEIDHAVTDSLQAFVAMWFDKSMDEVWNEGLCPAIRDTRLRSSSDRSERAPEQN